MATRPFLILLTSKSFYLHTLHITGKATEVGKPGVGKTRSLIEFAARKMSTAPLSILCSPNITTQYFVQRLAQEKKLHDRGTTSKLEDRVIEKLRRNPSPVFVDQANYLKEKGFVGVCCIWEMARTPVILVGTNALHTCDGHRHRYCWLIRRYPVQAVLGASARNGDSRVCSRGGPSHQAPSRRILMCKSQDMLPQIAIV
jgi:DNA transposition AAA+ family ATPase